MSFLVFQGFGMEMDKKEDMKNIDLIITLWLGMCIVLIYELVPYLGLQQKTRDGSHKVNELQ